MYLSYVKVNRRGDNLTAKSHGFLTLPSRHVETIKVYTDRPVSGRHQWHMH